jgi:hypothetical protein
MLFVSEANLSIILQTQACSKLTTARARAARAETLRLDFVAPVALPVHGASRGRSKPAVSEYLSLRLIKTPRFTPRSPR